MNYAALQFRRTDLRAPARIFARGSSLFSKNRGHLARRPLGGGVDPLDRGCLGGLCSSFSPVRAARCLALGRRNDRRTGLCVNGHPRNSPSGPSESTQTVVDAALRRVAFLRRSVRTRPKRGLGPLAEGSNYGPRGCRNPMQPSRSSHATFSSGLSCLSELCEPPPKKCCRPARAVAVPGDHREPRPLPHAVPPRISMAASDSG